MKKMFIIFGFLIIVSNCLSGMDKSGLRRRNVQFAASKTGQQNHSLFESLRDDMVNTTASTVITAGGSAIAYVAREALKQMAQREATGQVSFYSFEAINDKRAAINLGIGMALVGGMLCCANGAHLASGCLQECQRADGD